MNEKTALQIVALPIESLTPYEKNARQHKDMDVAVIKKSIEEFGFNDPIGIWGKKNIIVEGHGRLEALKQLGYKEVPCIRLDHLTDEQRKAYALTHNRSAEMSSWDLDNLDEELKALEAQFDLSALGFEEFLSNEEEEDEESKDDEFEVDDFIPEEPKTKPGDIYVLGNHRLICGDSSKEETLDALLGKETKIDLLLTDPPYNVDYEGGTAEKLKIADDNMNDDDYRYRLAACFKNADRFMKPGASFYIWFADKKSYWVHGAVLDTKWEIRQMPVWVKDTLVLGRNHYQFKDEPCYYGWKEGAASKFVDDRTLTTVWEFERPKRSLEHPTMKPVPLFSFILDNSSDKGDNVLDLFSGSGTTIISCEERGRRAFCVEKKPKYCDVDVKRYLRYTGSAEGCYLIRDGEKMELPQDFISVLDFKEIL